MTTGSFILQTDGASRGNPGPAAAGVVLKRADEVIMEHGEVYPDCTNNVSEYRALIIGLRRSKQWVGKAPLIIQMDSELVVRQLNGEYKVKNPGIRPLWEEARKALAAFTVAAIVHIPRAENARADALANAALDRR